MLRMQFAQRSMLEFDKQHPNSTNHYRHLAIDIRGGLDVSVLQKTFTKITQRHAALRSTVSDTHLETHLDPPAMPIAVFDCTNIKDKSIDKVEETLNAYGHNEFLSEPFDLEREPLWRCGLVKLSNNHHQLIIVIHPIIADDRAVAILLNEISSYYNGILNDKILELPLPECKEKNDPAPHWKLNTDAIDEEHWVSTLKHNNKIILPFAKQTDAEQVGKKVSFELPDTLIKQLKQSYPDNPLNDIILAAIYVVLYKYTNETDITIGNCLDNRSTSNRAINAFANLLPLHLNIAPDGNFRELIKQISRTKTQAIYHQMPISDLHELVLSESQDESIDKSFPFNILVTVNHNNTNLNLNGCETSKPLELDRHHCNFQYFELKLNNFRDSTEGELIYNTNAIQEQHIQGFIGHLVKTLSHMASKPKAIVSSTPILTSQDISKLNQFNATGACKPFDALIPEAFSYIAEAKKDALALAYHPPTGNPQTYSYMELEQYTNKIANHLLQNYRLQAGDQVAISLKRSSNLAAFMLGALKAGLVLVPLETEADQLFEYKLQNSKAKLIIADNETKDLFSGQITTLININDEILQDRIEKTDDSFYLPAITDDSPAYIMYSSGTSTGIPKCIELSHAGFANLLNALIDQQFPKQSKILCTALPTFDAFLFDFLAAWATGGSVHLTSDEHRYDSEFISDLIQNEGIDFAVFLPDLMMWLSPALPLKTVISMGRVPMESTLNEWVNADPTRVVMNGLGHTETGICLSLQRYQPGIDISMVGTPISNMQMHIVDPNTKSLSAIGTHGELFVSGPGVAKGYIGNDALNTQKFKYMRYDSDTQTFINCMQDDIAAIKMWASGDTATYEQLPDGSISVKMIGRTDRQIKLSGHSVNMDGVEAAIGACEFVKSVAVKANRSKNGLHAFVVIDEQKLADSFPHKDIDKKQLLRDFLKSTSLPSVAYPQFTMMIQLPLTNNGKINYKKLLLPPSIALKPDNNIDLREAIHHAWKTVLDLPAQEQLDENRSFEEYGGKSLHFVALQGIINKSLNLDHRNKFNLYSVLKLSKHGRSLDAKERRKIGKSMTAELLHNALNEFLNQKRPVNRTISSSPYSSPFSNPSTLYANSSQQRKTGDIKSSSMDIEKHNAFN